MGLTLVVGNKNYSSWSMRPWVALRGAGIAFEEVVVPLYTEEGTRQIRKITPSGKVPVLIDGDVTVWDSLAIIEYAAERFPEAQLWPEDRAKRAHARAISSEMHSGFGALRTECGMNLHRPVAAKTLSADAQANVARIQDIWTDCHARYGAEGPFLFGPFSAADAMYAPVVHRFVIYDLPAPPAVAAYLETLRAFPAFAEWTRAGLAETIVIDRFED